ncbi:uncharacterized protein BXZ73DRAFT_89727 [Epithele typhae]|uniref:uncharacterized protein n=1 Tax=Epithele typhae TaxID=378194 RepID=UPI0020081232|nr:uncharacterized protein BXZ73DRAFT_89727 [Epithele typhae]KAH9933592.1 hypothetical protein BXZ73DRAFT_89727 [Epithele typhae]
MSFRRVNRSKKVPGVKLRPAAPGATKALQSPESTWAKSSQLSDEESIANDPTPRPLKGVELCITGLSHATKSILFANAAVLGARHSADFTDRITHLIADEPGSAKYQCALEHGIPIMHPSWIEESYARWKQGDDVDLKASIKKHQLKPFVGVVLCLSGIEDVTKRQEIGRHVTKGGGTYVKVLERPVVVTHLLCANDSEANSEKVRYAQKFNKLGEARIHIVWEDWLWDSLQYGGRFDEDHYEVSKPPPPPREPPKVAQSSSLADDDHDLSSELQQAEMSGKSPKLTNTPTPANDDEEEIASVKRVPAVKLHLWQNVLNSRGFEVQNGRLVRSPSKSQVSAQPLPRLPPDSPTRAKPSRRGVLRGGEDSDDDRPAPKSAINAFSRARSFRPATKDVSTPAVGVRQPFQRTSTSTRAISFLQRSVGSIQAQGGMSADVPVASTSAIAGPSRNVSAAPEDQPGEDAQLSDAARTLFKGLRIRALGEARSASVKSAIEERGGTWVGHDDDGDVDLTIVRLVSGSVLAQQEPDAGERAKFRTECWLERCIFEERVCDPGEHAAFAPIEAEVPVSGADALLLSFSGLDHAEAFWVKRLLRALGIALAPNFSRRSTHLLCPSGVGAKADKAREWGTPIVDVAWLAVIARTGEIPLAPPSCMPDAEELDLQVQPVEPFVPQHTQPASTPPLRVDTKGKGKEKATEAMMVDITNAENGGLRLQQSLSYNDLDEPCPGQMEQLEAEAETEANVEAFGRPGLLLDDPGDTATLPGTSPAPSSDDPGATQSEAEASIPSSKPLDGRVPSSESPSPLRIPGGSSPHEPPSTPSRRALVKKATMDIQARITSLLGKRPSEDDGNEGPAKLKRHDSRRLKPLQRTKSAMSLSGSPQMDSPTSAFLARASPVPPVELELIPRSRPGSAAKPTSSLSNEADTTMEVDGDGREDEPASGSTGLGVPVGYANPQQHVELTRLKHLLNRPVVDAGARESQWGIDPEIEAELTLPQLPDVVEAASGKGKRPVPRARRARAKKGARA